jgi:hypothetical protein
MVAFIKKLFTKEPVVDTVIETPLHHTCPFAHRMPYGFYSVPAETGSAYCQCSCSQYVKQNETKITCIDDGQKTVPVKNWRAEMDKISKEFGTHI